MSEEGKNEKIYEKKTYFGIALDPLHVGTGGYRLGRVDNTIVREPGTNLPKIPGTTIEGCARTYAAYVKAKDNEAYINCADKEKHKEACPDENYKCPICVTFGYTDSKSKLLPEGKPKSLHGMAQFSDARILFFPVHSMLGPVWVTSPSVLEDVGLGSFSLNDENKIKTNLIKNDENKNGKKLNLGWLYLEKEGDFSLPNDKLKEIPEGIRSRVVLVSDKLFSQIVNSNLEVRTSVSIDPRTGAAEEGALFTYEAIPRATILWFDVIFNDPKHFDIDSSVTMDTIKQTLKLGLELFEILGIGGMQTRGFGRFKILNLEGSENANQ